MVELVASALIPAMLMYTRDFASRFGEQTETVIYEFANVLEEAGITPEQFRRGIARFKDRAGLQPWTVNPAEFVELCKPQPEDVGLPSRENAFKEFCRHGRWPADHKWSHAAVYVAGQRVGHFALTHTNERDSIARFNKRYDEVVKAIRDGANFDDEVPTPAQAPNESRRAKPERVSADCAKLREQLRRAK
ncbi:replication protein P [Paraferrimonas sedimenticola]|uniref:Uncharacterized protein n=1 Tax=Paraferrimonas sedimenticola TaxID=375674 RepID=A0AA37RRG3_9GAMM|nr:replication protein P [Paraferrimonas sedimenticola]GLP95315.1 hypothetical protein GCM10007895_06210 [Paraferrimonas sedimenticola]